MSCLCFLSTEEIKEAVRTNDFSIIEKHLEKDSEAQRAEVLRLLIKNGSPKLYDLILQWIPTLSPYFKEKLIVAAADSENEELLKLFLTSENTFDDDSFINALNFYVSGFPKRHIIRLLWKYFHPYERDAVDVSIMMTYQPHRP